MKSMTLKLDNEVLLNGDVARVHDWAREALDDGYGVIALDMSAVNQLDDAAVGDLVACFAIARERGAQMALTRLSPDLRQRLQSLLFSTIFELYDSTDEALRTLRSRAIRRGKHSDARRAAWV